MSRLGYNISSNDYEIISQLDRTNKHLENINWQLARIATVMEASYGKK